MRCIFCGRATAASALQQQVGEKGVAKASFTTVTSAVMSLGIRRHCLCRLMT
jgi:DNA-directed RNA polymerase subunit N (RpoN/RPB10)